jgi:Ca-activated chloride channel family protein
MNDNRLLPDDPKLTAYALGELSGDDRAAVEAALRENPALRVTVDEIRATVKQLEAALADEPVFAANPEPAPPRGIVIELNGHAPKRLNGHAHRPGKAETGRHNAEEPLEPTEAPRARPALLRFPQFYYVIATAAAACFAVMVALREPPTPPKKATTAAATTSRVVTLAPPNVLKPEDAIAPAVEPVLIDAVSAPTVSVTTAAVVPATAPDAEPAPRILPPPAFIEGNLSLISQARREQDANRNFGDGASRLAISRTPPQPLTTSVPSVASPGSMYDRPTATLLAETFTTPVTAPVVASATTPSVLPPDTATTYAPIPTAGAGEIVMLSPFMVTGEHAVGYAMANSQASSDKRVVARRDHLPHPPPGAKLGKNTEAYSYIRDNDFLSASDNPVSTFSIDLDTASYANVRRIIEHGSPPPRDAVRIEEMLNYFPYRYPAPKGDVPIAAAIEMADAPWAPTHRLVRIGLKAREVTTAQRPAASLVFLLDVSGSMNQPNKLPLVKHSMRLLVSRLRPDDRVAIVTYAGNSGLALASTPVAQARDIMNALDALTPGGSTNGAMGIELAYDIARTNFVPDGINRVILCTDGDFNVGVTSEGELVRMIEEKAGSGVFLTVLGFGMGNYKDATLEKLADKGNGNYGYIDTSREAEKMLVEQISGTLVTVAKDVKVQVEFNPANVSSYRLIGYENRLLRREDFNNDKVDAGEMGAGQTVTALYEIVPVGAVQRPNANVAPLDELKYAARGAVSSRLEMPSGQRDPYSNELLTVKVRYKKPDSLFSFPKALEFPLLNATKTFAKASADFRFAAAVAEFGMILRGSPHRGAAGMKDVAAWAESAISPTDDPGGYRGEFLDLVRKAQAMME